MKVAIAKEGNMVSGHFGHCEGFEVFDLENKTVVKREFIENPGHRPGFLPRFLAEKGINLIIAGGMGETAQVLFRENGVDVIVGVMGSLDDVIDKFIKGELKSTGSVCKEHQHEGDCGNH
ncbi:NifB/NifX family molybdenum-iron cluster-binding protein [Tepidibacter formicigenes]|jgi:predicted Fe-Mo cluster-binding NifX family protein|uniref:Predicted Fe-Mo cluster-binding protein, NifX family n=1 Tax=Tepidibacter formicigenes DSM 15518 TaxID=1123349 RepID=A0A1M6S083_9FIRM|nr:NifB/NifX family molybdenum-iron cluster-binding protein [Tepidibacter formicigenes]SHK38050.1 Predicted Fe-Mo cluster-binding protein, NifX family [Tepidibacter formicigenes DSM 15518]